MDTTRRDSRSTAAGVALALAGCAGLSLAVGDAIRFGSADTDVVVGLSWIVGWALLTWATIVGGAVAVHLLRAAVSRRRPATIEIVLVVATVAVIAGVIWAYPPLGSGAGVAPGMPGS